MIAASPRANRSVALISNSAAALIGFRAGVIRRLREDGWAVTALAPTFTARDHQRLAALGATPVAISMDRAGLKPWRDAWYCLRLAQTLRRLKPDASLAFFAKPVIFGGIAARLARVPRHVALIEGLGYVFDSDAKSTARRGLRWLTGRLYRIGLRRARVVLFNNAEDRDEFIDRGLCTVAQAHNMGGIGVDLNEWRVRSIPPGPPVFVLAARLVREKGVCEFAHASAIVRTRYPEARSVLLGGLDANPRSISRAEVEGWVAQGWVEWPGLVEDVGAWLCAAHVFVLPSFYREGVPRSSQEALAMGMPIITTDGVGCRETVTDGVNGFVVPPRDVEALADRMMRFVADPSLIASMGREGRLLAERRFDGRRGDEEILRALGSGTGADQ